MVPQIPVSTVEGLLQGRGYRKKEDNGRCSELRRGGRWPSRGCVVGSTMVFFLYAPLDPADRVHWVEGIKGRRGDGSVGAGDLRGIKKGEGVMMRTCSV